jgi:DNA-binding MarR family transcriptional regulator
MSTDDSSDAWPPMPIGALLRFGLQVVRVRIYDAVDSAGFHDVRPAHVTLFRWPGPDGRRPTEIATDVQLSKQRVNDLLRHLEAHGYLRLRPDPSDSRARIVRLTPRGRSLHAAAVEAHAAVEREWAQLIGRRRYELLREALVDVVAVPGRPPPR